MLTTGAPPTPGAATSLRRLGLNWFWLLLARVLAQGLALVFTALLARGLGVAGFGQYTFIASIVFLGNVFTTFGLDSLLIRQIARTHSAMTPLVPAAFWIQIALSALFIALVVLSGSLPVAISVNAPALQLFSLSLVPLAFYTIYSAVLRAFERMDLYLLLNLAASVLQTASAVIVFLARADLMALIVALLVCQSITAVAAGALCRRGAPAIPRVWQAPGLLAPALRAALPFALLTTVGVIYQRAGVLTLAAISGDEATGWFSAAARIVETTKIVPQALLGALFPLLSGARGAERAARLLRGAMGISVGFSAIAVVVCTLLAQPLIVTIYGGLFSPSVDILRILALSLIPYAISANLSLGMTAAGHEWLVLRATAAALLIALLLFAVLVPRYGLGGAGWASLLGEMAQAALFAGASRTALSPRS